MTRGDAIRATVRSLRRTPPEGLDDCSSDGTIGVRVVESTDHLTYTVDLPTNPRKLDADGNPWRPAPGSIAAAVITEYGRQCERLACCEATARAATLGTPGQGQPVATAVVCDADGRLCVTIAEPWTAAQLTALRKLEKQRAAQVALEELARGPDPPEIKVIVRLDETGHVDLDQLTENPGHRACVLAALAAGEEDPPDHPPGDGAP